MEQQLEWTTVVPVLPECAVDEESLASRLGKTTHVEVFVGPKDQAYWPFYITDENVTECTAATIIAQNILVYLIGHVQIAIGAKDQAVRSVETTARRETP